MCFKICSRLVIFACILTLSLGGLMGCGFALKQSQPMPFQSVELKMAGCPHFQQALRTNLRAHHVTVYDLAPQEISSPVLTVQCPILTTEPLVYDGGGQLRRQRLHYSISAELITSSTVELTAKTIREQQLNSNQSLGDEAEIKLIVQEMQETLIQQLMNQLSRHTHYANK